jgi:hypothetical protein
MNQRSPWSVTGVLITFDEGVIVCSGFGRKVEEALVMCLNLSQQFTITDQEKHQRLQP